ncbi:MAG: tRNA dimethylallyltransferase [Candidatus Ozemobacter sibiricus]|jgi:tRNA dimethylallyltransferase|uniref:tRNA dimethylallyltransferase n=1 Tax=Candidatus Ozemobacter sibiricus TaxID=2268124 RepID=A0A367ZU32_9BACT|nr:MAG: tRNA dimethylallyltransferase [Candidatus Ozemobacter sibiricus]
MTSARPPLIALLGPTASGKSSLALELAAALGLEIVNCDSRQIYRGMEIGTAKPTPAERARVPHHLLDLVEPDQPFSAGDYRRAARACLEGLWRAGRIPLVVGGTGFYFEALVHGLPELPAPASGPSRWNDLLATQGLPALVAELRRRDPDAASQVDLANPRRVVRALEIVEATGRPLAESRRRVGGLEADLLVIVGSRPRHDLWERIRARTEAMCAAGLRAEAEWLFATYPPDAPGLQTIGYAEWRPYMAGQVGEDAVKREIIVHSRQYAKRQETWFRKRPGAPLRDFSDPGLLARLREEVASFLAAYR